MTFRHKISIDLPLHSQIRQNVSYELNLNQIVENMVKLMEITKTRKKFVRI